MKCEYCGAQLPDQGGFCPACGKFHIAREEEPMPASDPGAVYSGGRREKPEEKEVPREPACPVCGYSLEPGRITCGHCGHRLEVTQEVKWEQVIAESEARLEAQYQGPLTEEDLAEEVSPRRATHPSGGSRQPARPGREPDHTSRNVLLAVLATVAVMLLLFLILYFFISRPQNTGGAESVSQVSLVSAPSRTSTPPASSENLPASSVVPSASHAANAASSKPNGSGESSRPVSSSQPSVSSQPVRSEPDVSEQPEESSRPATESSETADPSDEE